MASPGMEPAQRVAQIVLIFLCATRPPGNVAGVSGLAHSGNIAMLRIEFFCTHLNIVIKTEPHKKNTQVPRPKRRDHKSHSPKPG